MDFVRSRGDQPLEQGFYCIKSEIQRFYINIGRAVLVPTLADRGYRVVSATDPHGRNLGRYSSLED
jgi:hypothetical protein